MSAETMVTIATEHVFCRDTLTVASICLIRQGRYPIDPRLVHEVAAMVELGHNVDLICLGERGQPRYERQGALTIRRLPVATSRISMLLPMYSRYGTKPTRMGFVIRTSLNVARSTTLSL